MGVEPVPGEPAAVADLGDERALVIADLHAGIEAGLRKEGVELASGADRRREHLLALLDRTDPDRLVVLGDLSHGIGEPTRAERAELLALFESVAVPTTVAKGNHDGDLDEVLPASADVTITPAHGKRLGPIGIAHGHTWPSPAVLAAEVVCVGHEHPQVRLEDEVGGTRVERAWLRGSLEPAPFEAHHDREIAAAGDLVVVPAFNERSGGTWINAGQAFLSPFLPDGLAEGQAYLLDGTRLGDYRRV